MATTPYSSPQPMATTPYSSQPMATTPYSSQPMATTPYSSQPMVTTPYSSQPMATTPYSSQPMATTPYSYYLTSLRLLIRLIIPSSSKYCTLLASETLLSPGSPPTYCSAPSALPITLLPPLHSLFL
ncbi:unnamed protein product [Staurois parvus]|uniref:Uncharacterized protein n=1 Tax=Staurois parvus TaxID=386267 RepID=A0ABN9G7R3_9NEOB|nr:unnamed protein product [Staurois parvus]